MYLVETVAIGQVSPSSGCALRISYSGGGRKDEWEENIKVFVQTTGRRFGVQLAGERSTSFSGVKTSGQKNIEMWSGRIYKKYLIQVYVNPASH